MFARAEMSTQTQKSESELSASRGMSVALIGPNDAHRRVVAEALSSSQGRKVHEFIDYPAQLSDLPRMLGQNFDVVLVDVDTDESYALQVIASVAELGLTVMAYSARDDQELLMNCMRAGARDFLPLPAGSDPDADLATPTLPRHAAPAPQAAARPVEPKPATPVPQAAAKPAEPRPTAPPMAAVPRSNVTPIVPERRVDPMTRFSEERAALDTVISEPVHAAPVEQEATAHELPVSEFAEWDAAHLRRGPAPSVQHPESRPRPSLVPERKQSEAPSRTAPPSVVPTPAPAVERPPVSAEIFRSAQLDYSNPDVAEIEKRKVSWVKWVLIAAGPLVLALVLLIVFTRQSAQKNAAKLPPVPEQTAPAPAAPEGQLIVEATGKPSAATPEAKPSPATPTTSAANQPAEPEPTPVSPDAMAQQLVAPTRIAGNIKKAPQPDGPPPSAPAPVTLDENGALPGSVFAGSSKVKVAPHVVAISAGVADGMIIHKTQPVYPKFAQDAHITGKVVLKATITKQGTIEGIQVLSGPKILAPSAVDAVKTWKYRPYMLDNQPVAVETNITVAFGITGK